MRPLSTILSFPVRVTALSRTTCCPPIEGSIAAVRLQRGRDKNGGMSGLLRASALQLLLAPCICSLLGGCARAPEYQ